MSTISGAASVFHRPDSYPLIAVRRSIFAVIKAVDEARTVHGLEIPPYPSSLLIPRSSAIASSLFTSPGGSGTPVLRRCCLMMCSFSPGT